MTNFVKIDGGIMEGGGQIIRISAALSCILGVPIRISNIRNGRPKPGLRPSHLAGLNCVRDLCGGKLTGCSVGSTQVTLVPRCISGGDFTVDAKTAGSVTLIIQAALPILVYAARKSCLIVKGGTNVDFSPPIDYFVRVFPPLVQRFGVGLDCQLIRRGLNPKGGGEVHLTVSPVERMTGAVLDSPQQLKRVDGVSFVAGTVPLRVAAEMADSATKALRKCFSDAAAFPVSISLFQEDASLGNGAAIILTGETVNGLTLGASALGQVRTPADKVGQSAATELLETVASQVCLDQYAQDQVIIFMALAEGTSRFLVGPLTLHTQTAIHFTSLLTKVEFKVTDLKTSPETFLIECQGLGLVNKLKS
nr:EOG090X05X4 [Polyphemus pediculus]